MNWLDNYTAHVMVVIIITDGRDFNLQTRGGTSDTAIYGLKDSVNDVSRLLLPSPLTGWC